MYSIYPGRVEKLQILPMCTVNEMTPQGVRNLLVRKPKQKCDERQLTLDFGE